jgi:hypothetical protein
LSSSVSSPSNRLFTRSKISLRYALLLLSDETAAGAGTRLERCLLACERHRSRPQGGLVVGQPNLRQVDAFALAAEVQQRHEQP